jgi:hypothetical protein
MVVNRRREAFFIRNGLVAGGLASRKLGMKGQARQSLKLTRSAARLTVS